MNKSDIRKLCGELRELLQHELDSGNRIIAIDTGWSNVMMAVRLARPLDMEYIKKAAEHDSDLKIWESHDIKNPQEAGVLCKSHRQTLSGRDQALV